MRWVLASLGSIALVGAVPLVVGCGKGAVFPTAGAPSSGSPGGATTPPASALWTPQTGDLRFKEVASAAVSNMGAYGSYGVVGGFGTGMEESFTNAVGSPFEIGPGSCEVGVLNCGWQVWTNVLPPGETGLNTTYSGNAYQGFSADMASVFGAPNMVLTCLDLEPASFAYGAEWIESAQSTGFDERRETVPSTQIQTTASQDGQQGRVITAVSFDAQGLANLFSYGWSNDASTVYDVQTDIVAGKDVPSAAIAFAGEGYLITAFGGNEANGYVLIGTRVRGQTTARPIWIFGDSASTFPAGGLSGYAPVLRLGYIYSSNSPAITIYEH